MRDMVSSGFWTRQHVLDRICVGSKVDHIMTSLGSHLPFLELRDLCALLPAQFLNLVLERIEPLGN